MAVYHEKQEWAFCAKHTINNLLQRDQFSQLALDSICEELCPDCWINPHKSLLSIGNYDVNVVEKALKQVDLNLYWFDRRNPIERINLQVPVGFIVSTATEHPSFSPLNLFGYLSQSVSSLFGFRHWYALKKIGPNFYNLDSKLDEPQLIGNEMHFQNFARELINKGDLIFIVTEPNTLWQNDHPLDEENEGEGE